MRSSEIGELVCPVAKAVAVVGDPWSLMIVRELFMGSRRFEDLQAQLRASPALLTQRLKDLVAAGVLTRRARRDEPSRFDYHLTRKGVDLWPLMMALKHWGDRWGGWRGAPPADLHHRACGGSTGLRLVCGCCSQPLSAFDVELRPRRAMRQQRAALARQQQQHSLAKAEARTRARRAGVQAAGRPLRPSRPTRHSVGRA